jgi:preprotein translocase subunit SecD
MKITRTGTLVLLPLITALFFLGCSEAPRPMVLEFRLAQTEPGEGLTEMTFEPTGEKLYLHDEVLIDNADICSAEAITWQGRQVIDLRFTETGKEKLALLTGEHLKERIAMVVDGRLLSAPMINAPILEGRTLIDGAFTKEEARRIAAGIRASLRAERS